LVNQLLLAPAHSLFSRHLYDVVESSKYGLLVEQWKVPVRPTMLMVGLPAHNVQQVSLGINSVDERRLDGAHETDDVMQFADKHRWF
jgi:hypothetical protein